MQTKLPHNVYLALKAVYHVLAQLHANNAKVATKLYQVHAKFLVLLANIEIPQHTLVLAV